MYDNGQMVVFRAESDEPTKVHPVQIWDTPFTSVEFAASNPVEGGYLGKVGNADLVRGISDVFAIQRSIANLQPSRQIFEDLVAALVGALLFLAALRLIRRSREGQSEGS